MQMTQDATEARWARFSKIRSVDLLKLRPHHRARKLARQSCAFLHDLGHNPPPAPQKKLLRLCAAQ
jgi:hypothetical protein